MSGLLLTDLLSNTLAAALIGLGGWLAAHPFRRPALAHTLFVLALLELVTPPLWRVEVWSPPPVSTAPASIASPTSHDAAAPITTTTDPSSSPRPSPVAAPAEPRDPSAQLGATRPGVAERSGSHLDLADLVVLLWGLGSAVGLALLLRRVATLRRFVRLLQPADAQLLAEVREAQRRVGLRRAPRVLVCDAALPPSVFVGLGGATLVAPSRIVAALDRHTRLGLWTHELAHVRRGDVWLRWVEAMVQVALWWHPLCWWLTRQLRAAEERACDAWATAGATPEQRRSYCDALLAFAGAKSTPVPLAASAAARGSARDLRRWRQRLEDAMTTNHATNHHAASRFALAMIAVLTLPLAIAQEPADESRERADKLDRTQIAFRVDDAPLEHWVDQLAHAAGLSVVVEKSAVDADRELTTLRGMQLPEAPVRRVLDAVTALTDLRWRQERTGLIRIFHGADTSLAPVAGVRCHGAFATPRIVALERDETVLSLVTRLRLTDRADLSAVQLLRHVRGDRPRAITLDVDAMLRTGVTRANVPLKPGDVVTVPERLPDDLPPLTQRPGSKVHFVVDPTLLVIPGAEQLALLTEPQRVQRDGTIFVPFVGPVYVNGLTRDEISDLVTSSLQEKFAFELKVWARLE